MQWPPGLAPEFMAYALGLPRVRGAKTIFDGTRSANAEGGRRNRGEADNSFNERINDTLDHGLLFQGTTNPVELSSLLSVFLSLSLSLSRTTFVLVNVALFPRSLTLPSEHQYNARYRRRFVASGNPITTPGIDVVGVSALAAK